MMIEVEVAVAAVVEEAVAAVEVTTAAMALPPFVAELTTFVTDDDDKAA